MRWFNKLLTGLIFVGMMATMTTTALCAPIVTYNTSGSSSNWTLDFSVTNNLGVNDMDIYFFGVLLPAPNITGSPTNWLPFGIYNSYNNTWLNYGYSLPDLIHNGETKSGFEALVNTVEAPTSVQWFAVAWDWTHTTCDQFNVCYPTAESVQYNGAYNPYFEGTATSNSVPEPSTFLLLGAGIAGVGLLRRRFKS
jgi:hypothetical protein